MLNERLSLAAAAEALPNMQQQFQQLEINYTNSAQGQYIQGTNFVGGGNSMVCMMD